MIDKLTELMTDLSVCVHSCRPLFSSEGELESGEITAIYKQVGTPFFCNIKRGKKNFYVEMLANRLKVCL